MPAKLSTTIKKIELVTDLSIKLSGPTFHNTNFMFNTY
jgi:hypothetical protein